MVQYYKPGADDSTIDVSADEANKYLGGEAGLKNSGYVLGAPPENTPDPLTDPNRYSRLPPGSTQEQIDAANAAKYATKTPEQAAEDYRQSALKNVQDRINNIQKVYGEKLDSELALQKPVNENNEGRVKSLSALMGLGGSSSADTRTSKIEQDNANINRGISNKVNAEKAAALEAIYGNIDSGVSKVYEAQLETNKTNQAKLLEDVKNNALSQVQALASNLAGTGKTFDDWVKADNGDALKKIMDQTGQSEYQIRASWTSSIPENLRPTIHTSYIDDGKGGTIMRQVSFDPVSKKAESKDYQLAVPASTFNSGTKPIEGKNGELFVQQADGSYKDVSPNAANNKLLAEADLAKKQAELDKLKKKTPHGPHSSDTEDQAIKDILANISNAKDPKTGGPLLGGNGFLSPENYIIMRNTWINEKKNPSTFDSKMKGFRDPNNPYYGVTKAPVKKTTTTPGDSTKTKDGPF